MSPAGPICSAGVSKAQPLKRVELSFGGQSVRGDAIVTRRGLEGGAVYALSAPLREAIAADGDAVLRIALRPDLSPADLQRRLETPRKKQSLSTFLRKAAGLSPVAIGLLHEAAPGKLVGMGAADLAALINAVPVRLVATAPLERAISTAGGIAFDEIDDAFMLRRRPGVFVAGEMLDWEAPTGGYLLQASFATGVAAARGALAWLARGTERSQGVARSRSGERPNTAVAARPDRAYLKDVPRRIVGHAGRCADHGCCAAPRCDPDCVGGDGASPGRRHRAVGALRHGGVLRDDPRRLRIVFRLRQVS